MDDLVRYHRQIVFEGLGLPGQRRLLSSRVVIIGLGGLGSWAGSLLARAGVGFIRLVDDDSVELTNLHRQGMYDQDDALEGRSKISAAAERIRRINSDVVVDTHFARADSDNIESLVGDVDLILDGTDNFPTRFCINDIAVKLSIPWIFAGVVGCEGQTMTILPGAGRSPCLRCIMPDLPPPCQEPTCKSFGVIGSAVAAISSIQVTEAIKILSGSPSKASPYLTKFNFWDNTIQHLDISDSRLDSCPCCRMNCFDYLAE